MKRALDVAVLGCGTAGSAAAIFLARAGHAVTVYERVPDPGPVGAGITMQPSGLHVSEELGLREKVVSRGSQIDRLVCKTFRDRIVIDLEYASISPDLCGFGTHRGVLFDALFTALKKENVAWKFGVTAEDLARSHRRGWQWVVDDQGNRHGPHELILVCDGARSHLRDDTTIRKSVRAYPWGALWFVAKDPDARYGNVLHQFVRGSRRMMGLLPTGLGPDPTNTTPLVSLFFSIRADRVAEWRAGSLDQWKAECAALSPSCMPVLDQIKSHDDVLFAAYHDVQMYPWNTANVVYLGDAAHAMSPQLGQGCNLALCDAMTLAHVLEREEHLPLALDHYSRHRYAHLAFYQFVTRWLTPFFQGDLDTLGVLRDIAMPIMCKFGPFARVMARSMTGTVAGILGEWEKPRALGAHNPPSIGQQ